MFKLRFFIITILAIFITMPCFAGDADTQRLQNSIDRLQNEMNTMQKEFYQTSYPSTGGGKNDAATNAKLMAMEEKMRDINGKIEELQYHVEDLIKKTDGLTNDLNQRIAALQNDMDKIRAGGVPSSSPADNSANKVDEKKDLSATEANKKNDKKDIVANIDIKKSDAKDSAVGSLTPSAEYEQAFSLLRQSKYDEAEIALKKFIANNPDNSLVENAYYWLGETFYSRKKYSQSAEYFVKGYKAYPKGNKAIDNLFKLALSLDKLDKQKESCITLSELKSKFPDMTKDIKAKVSSEMKRLSCSS